MNWKRNPTVNTSGTSMLIDLYDEVSVDEVRKAFGEPEETESYFDEDSGYTGLDWHFKSESGQVATLYFRFGVPRIGGYSVAVARDFKLWLFAKLQKNVVPAELTEWPSE